MSETSKSRSRSVGNAKITSRGASAEACCTCRYGPESAPPLVPVHHARALRRRAQQLQWNAHRSRARPKRRYPPIGNLRNYADLARLTDQIVHGQPDILDSVARLVAGRGLRLSLAVHALEPKPHRQPATCKLATHGSQRARSGLPRSGQKVNVWQTLQGWSIGAVIRRSRTTTSRCTLHRWRYVSARSTILTSLCPCTG